MSSDIVTKKMKTVAENTSIAEEKENRAKTRI